MRCRGCLSDRLDPVFEMEPMPLAGTFPATREEALALPKYPLTWLLCADCGLVNVTPDIPDDDIFATYSYAASTVPGLVRHHRELAALLIASHREPVSLLEIGCNDGVLLDQLPADWDLVGVDPSDVAAAHQGRYTLVNEPFTSDLDLPQFDVITSSNSFAHFSGIADALDGVARLLRPGGEFWIEVHDLDATLASGQWDTIYHEHKVEWSVDSLASVGARHGLSLEHYWRRPLHGGIIRALFRPGSTGRGRDDKDFASLQRAYTNRVPVRADAAYGAAARGSVYLNQCDTGVRYVVDGSPLRADRFIPGVGIPIVGPDDFEQPDRTLITAWNHAPDIMARHPDYHGWVSAWDVRTNASVEIERLGMGHG